MPETLLLSEVVKFVIEQRKIHERIFRYYSDEQIAATLARATLNGTIIVDNFNGPIKGLAIGWLEDDNTTFYVEQWIATGVASRRRMMINFLSRFHYIKRIAAKRRERKVTYSNLFKFLQRLFYK